MTILEWLQESMIRLHKAGVDSPRRDCLVLVEDELKKDRTWVLTHHDNALQGDTLQRLETLLVRRINREPLAYIRGKAWFYGRFFDVNSDVLVPRPESEAFIEILKTIEPKQLFDIGTGSGCLAITAKLEMPDTDVIATDTDTKSLTIAKNNAKKHNVTIGFVETSLLDGLEKFDFSKVTIVANLPYVKDGDVSSPEIKYEPEHSLFSGKKGLDHYTKFFHQINQIAHPPKFILCESLENQHKSVEKLANSGGFKLVKTEVLVQLFKRT